MDPVYLPLSQREFRSAQHFGRAEKGRTHALSRCRLQKEAGQKPKVQPSLEEPYSQGAVRIKVSSN